MKIKYDPWIKAMDDFLKNFAWEAIYMLAGAFVAGGVIASIVFAAVLYFFR